MSRNEEASNWRSIGELADVMAQSAMAARSGKVKNAVEHASVESAIKRSALVPMNTRVEHATKGLIGFTLFSNARHAMWAVTEDTYADMDYVEQVTDGVTRQTMGILLDEG